MLDKVRIIYLALGYDSSNIPKPKIRCPKCAVVGEMRGLFGWRWVECAACGVVAHWAPKETNPVQEAERFRAMVESGLSLEEISLQTGENPQNIRNRLALLRLTPEEQEKIRRRELSMIRALMMLKKREVG